MNLPKTTDTNRFNLSVMLLQSGLYVVIGSITILVMNLAVSGGFYDTKKRSYFAPINSKRVGVAVAIEDTSPYSAMQINYKGLESFFC